MATVDLPDVLTVEDVETDLDDSSLDNPWQAVLYNCDWHTYAQVIQQLILAIGCSRDQAYELAWIVDHHGRPRSIWGEGRVRTHRAYPTGHWLAR
jgi:hypothetical protein